MRIAKGNIVSCKTGTYEPVFARVIMASDTDPQSVLVEFGETTAYRVGPGMAVGSVVALTIDYKNQVATDLFGNNWDIIIAESL